MPNAAASFDADFGATPARRGARKPHAKPAKRRKGRRFPFQAVARYGAVAMTVLVGAGIVANALLLQKGPHPAPFFAAKPTARTAGKPVALAPAAEAATEPATPAVAPAAEPQPGPPVAGTRTAGSAKAASSQHADDPIARLISGAAPAPHHRSVKAENKTPRQHAQH